MSIIHGKAISAEELERSLSREFDARSFASLCNSISWCSARQHCSTLPSFTERVNVKDKGIDASWNVPLPDGQGYASGLLGPGWNVFQYKQRDIFAQGRSATYSNIKSDMQRALKKLYEETQKRPTRYVLFTNLDLTPAQNQELCEAIRSEYDQNDEAVVSVVGAGELVSFLVDLPHVRNAYFDVANFCTWEIAHKRHENEEMAMNARVEVVGREDELNELRALIDAPDVKSIVLSGPQGIGKTRLALLATAHQPNETIVALDALDIHQLMALATPSIEVVVIVDDPEIETAESLVREVLSQSGIKLVITLPTADNAPIPNFGQDNRVRVLQVKPLDEIQSHELLKKADAAFDYGVESWVVEQAGGNPRILLLAANVGAEIRDKRQGFLDTISAAFENKVRTRFGEPIIEVLRRLSLLSKVGVKNEAKAEIGLICEVFGGNTDVNVVLETLLKLERAGLVRVGGSFAEVLPPLLANRLAASVLRGRFSLLVALFARLGPRSRSRFIARLRLTSGDEVTQFWNELFSQEGLLHDFSSALHNIHLLSQIAGTVPERVARLLYEGLNGLTLEQRYAVEGNVRRELVHVLEQLLFRRKSSDMALRSLALLAEAENETWGNNATGVFCEVFHALHHQMPLSLSGRIKVLNKILADSNSVAMKLLGMKAAEEGLRNAGGYLLRQSHGPEPLDTWPEMTWGEIWEYNGTLLDTLLIHAQSNEPQIAQVAREHVPHALIECAVQTPPEHVIPKFETVVGWVLDKSVPVAVTKLVDAVESVLKAWRKHLDGDKEDWVKRYKDCISQLEGMAQRLEQTDFPTRLQRWTGDWVRGGYEQIPDEGDEQISHQDTHIRGLAREVIANSALLTDDLLMWLCSEEVKQGRVFLNWLGKSDMEKVWFTKMAGLAAELSGTYGFSAYCSGVIQHDPAFVDEQLDKLTEADQITPAAIVLITRQLPHKQGRVEQIVELLRARRVDPRWVARVLTGGEWYDTLSEDDTLNLLNAIAGPDWQGGDAVIDFLGLWVHAKRSISGSIADLAWECLEKSELNHHNAHWYFDQLAAYLTKSAPERGFVAFEIMISQPYSKHWMPLDLGSENAFWEALRAADSHRTIGILLSVSRNNPSARFSITWNLREALDPEADVDALIAYASADEANARIISESITSGKPGFWPIATAIAAKYSDIEDILINLEHGIMEMGRMVSGPWSEHYKKCQERVKVALDDPKTPSGSRDWLREMYTHMGVRAEKELISEYDEQADQVRERVESADASQRQWAIRVLARHLKPKQLHKMFSKKEVQTALGTSASIDEAQA